MASRRPRAPPSARSVRRARPARLSVRSMRNLRCALSLSRGCFFSRATPVVAHSARAGPARRSSARAVTRRRRRPRRRAHGRWPARPGTPPSRPRTARPVRECSSSSRTSVTVRSRKARSCETMTIPPRSPCHQFLQPGQPVEVEVVRRLVEQREVEAGQDHGGQGHRASCPPDSVATGCSATSGERHLRARADEAGLEVPGRHRS